MINFSALSRNDNFSFHLAPNEIHVWLLNANKNENNSFNTFLTHKKSEHSRSSVRSLLSHYLQTSPDYLQIQKTIHGKPILINHPELFFSVAHSDELLAVALAHHPVGVDLEKKRGVRAIAIAQKFFAPHEIAFLQTESEERFFNLWTAKEAALKADGCGITKGLRNAITVLEKGAISGLYLKERYMKIIPWFLKEKISTALQNSFDQKESSQNFSSFESYFIGSVASFDESALIRWYDGRSVDSISA